MNRSSGMVIFSSGYTICFIAILCCMHIQKDARELRQDQLISPEAYPSETISKDEIKYVLMNPIKKDYPVDLIGPNPEPNILIATLPDPAGTNAWASDVPITKIDGRAAEQLIAKELDASGQTRLNSPTIFEDSDETAAQLQTPQLVENQTDKSRGWGIVGLVGESLRTNPFSMASSRQPAESSDCSEFVDAGSVSPILEAKDPMAEFVPSESIAFNNAIATHVLIANDQALVELRDSIRLLANIESDSLVVEGIENALNEISESGNLDAGLCEACLYRVLDQAEQLPRNRHDEDGRLIDLIREQVIDQVNDWIDQLNGLIPEEPQPELDEMDEMDLQRLNTALQSLRLKLF